MKDVYIQIAAVAHWLSKGNIPVLDASDNRDTCTKAIHICDFRIEYRQI